MNDQIPEYTITKRDLEDADLLLRKIEHTEWELEDLLLQIIRKYAHLAETARSLQYLPAMSEVKDAVDTIMRDSTFNSDTEIKNFYVTKKFYMDKLEPLRKHLHTLSKQFRETVTIQAVVEEP